MLVINAPVPGTTRTPGTGTTYDAANASTADAGSIITAGGSSLVYLLYAHTTALVAGGHWHVPLLGTPLDNGQPYTVSGGLVNVGTVRTVNLSLSADNTPGASIGTVNAAVNVLLPFTYSGVWQGANGTRPSFVITDPTGGARVGIVSVTLVTANDR